jgi:hypothetical protein
MASGGSWIRHDGRAAHPAQKRFGEIGAACSCEQLLQPPAVGDAARVDKQDAVNLSSALRVFVLGYYKKT